MNAYWRDNTSEGPLVTQCQMCNYRTYRRWREFVVGSNVKRILCPFCYQLEIGREEQRSKESMSCKNKAQV